MGKLDHHEQVATALIALAAAFAFANGIFMTIEPFQWYQSVPSAKFTGPPNQHFLRDIGFIYLTCGALLAYAAFDLRDRWLFAIAGNVWLTLHGKFHVYEVVTGVCSPNLFWQDFPGAVIPPALVWAGIALVLARQKVSPAGLPKIVLIHAFKSMTAGDVDWLREIALAPGQAFSKILHLMPATTHRRSAPADLFHIARIAASLAEDCSACTSTAVRIALRDGVSRDLVNSAIAAKPPEGLLRIAFDFGQSIALRNGNARNLGDTIEQAYGRAVRIELAITSATVRVYPAIKRGLADDPICGMTATSV